MPTTIVLARHGQSDWNQTGRWQGQADRPLTELGRAQARSLASTLASEPPVAVYSSDLARTRETAEIVAAALGLAINLDPRLREIDVGEWSGLTMEEVECRYPDGVRRRRESGTGWLEGESHETMSLRVVESVHAIAAAHPRSRVLAVTHGGPMRALWMASGGERGSWPHYDNCAVSEIAVESGQMRRIDSEQGGGLHQQVQG
jgi:broad specificity phosphatase PhoE